jgi:hypothetical protein
VLFEGGLADRDGRRWPGARTARRYSFADGMVTLDDRLLLDGVRGKVRYQLPAHLADITVSATGAEVHRNGTSVSLTARGGQMELLIRGTYRA